MNNAARENSVSALLVGDYQGDRLLLQDVFRQPGWRLFEARGPRQAMHYLELSPVQVVIAESQTPKWNWKEILNDLRELAHPPQLIVTSHLADDYLWAEVLNVGGYDVLPQPFEREELERVVAAARRHYEVQPKHEVQPKRPSQQTSIRPAAGVA
jgi:DNA-binding response OmpR family regulator